MEHLDYIVPLAVYLFTEWDEFRALLVFPFLVLAFKLIGKLKARQAIRPSDLSPRSDVIWSITNNIAIVLTNTFIWFALLAGFYDWVNLFWADVAGLGKVSVMAGWPLWLQLVCALLLFDFVNYWGHRLIHQGWAWDIHALHHSDRTMNFMTAVRIHILESLFLSVFFMLVLGLLGLPVEAAAAAGVLRLWHSFYIHSDLPIDHGPLRKIIASPNYHRWHHADDPAVYGKNLCDMFPVWDLLFGTHHDPGRCETPPGVSDVPDDAIAGQLHPFRLYARRLLNLVRRCKTPDAERA